MLLEGMLHAPTEVELAPIIVLCHPQPASSDMNDTLNVALARRLAEIGMLAMRFNFRGVGSSQGQQTDGRLEPLDLAGAIDFALTQPAGNPAKICVIGHGFGAYIALLYAPFDARLRTVVSISLPLYRAASGFQNHLNAPSYLLRVNLTKSVRCINLNRLLSSSKAPKVSR